MESEKDLKKKRASIKCRLTNFKKYVSSFIDLSLSVHQQAELKLRVVGSQNLINDFNQVQGKIEDISSELDIEKQLESREEFEREYYNVLALVECMTSNDEKSINMSDLPNTSSNSIKLPIITIPNFDGSYEHWLEFRDTFMSLVHNCKTITQIQKFHYLKSSLKGNAKSVIDSLEFSADNYEVAWELMINRFDNTKLLIHNHVKSMFIIQALTKESPGLLRKLTDNILKNLRALKLLGEPTEHWDTLIIYIVTSKLDPVTERDWEQHRSTILKSNGKSKYRVKLDDLLEFLGNKADILESLIASHSKSNVYSGSENKKQTNNNVSTPKVHCNVVTNKSSTKSQTKAARPYKACLMCNEKHPLYSCQNFLDLSAEDRFKIVKDKQLCINCMRSGHSVGTCVFGPCRKCDKKHNSLICEVISNTLDSNSMVTLTTTEQPTVTSTGLANGNMPTHSHSLQVHNVHSNNYNKDNSMPSVQHVLLSTAIVDICGQSGVYHKARVILDSGSERSFITQSFCEKLNTQIIQSTQQIHGVGNSITQCSQSCNIELKSRNSSFNARVQCLILPQISSKLPTTTLSSYFNIPDNITLADPRFYDSQQIDLLIGADLFWELINEGKMRLKNGPYLQNTKLGWIVSGLIQSFTQKPVKHVSCNLTHSSESDTCSLDQLLRKFWEIEELPMSTNKLCSDEELACEEHFIKTTKRLADGRFSVRIPLKHLPEKLGDTRNQAERRFYALEKKLQRNPTYKKLYSDFIHEYIELGHMSIINNYNTPHYFLPHHGVFREHAITTKLRVVFDAGMVSSSGVSLNDLQMVGPAIQGDLLSILLKFRENRYVACADIEKMYRQVLIDTDQRDLQLILWRDDPSDTLKVYQLNTVTYGTASAPFLSCRCVKQLAEECEVPYVTETIKNNFYVDDLICGANSISELNDICTGTSQVLSSACLTLRKWVFNFDRANPNDSQSVTKQLAVSDNVQNKTLGIGWNNNSDNLNYYSQVKTDMSAISKRIILSHASQIFDPLGLISPVITVAKTLLQKCWLLKLEWDEPVPDDVAQVWLRFINSLSSLSNLQIPRHVMCVDPTYIELHIFTDASQTAYGACAYIRTINSESAVTVRLLCSKGKVAPTKPTTIPRLELCGAVLGARLYSKVIKSLRSTINKVVFWTDSTIVLGWLGMQTNLLKTYVQNRTAEIHDLTKEHPWRHVSGKDNPADLVSRGQGLDTLSASSLWWAGPQFLHDANFEVHTLSNNNNNSIHIELPELKSNVLCHVVNQASCSSLFPFSRFSQYSRIKRAAAYVLRFIYNTRNKNSRRTGLFTVEELESSELTLARLSQQESFADVYDSLTNKRGIKKNAQLLKLNLFIDNNNLIRVGGRIQNSNNFSFNKKHPVLLSAKHWLTVLLFRYEHHRTMHAAPQLLLFTIRETWWPVGGRNLAKGIVHACVKCARLRATTLSPIMGNLPPERLDPGFPFLRCGVDYAGPVFTLNRKGRGAKLQKSYICLFVCFVTRAVHLELVGDLSSEAYLLALKRFISRRGKPIEIFSDNGKNFVGLMNEFTKFLESCSDDIKEYAISHNIKFTMIPFYASHFGGLWEAGVKSCKHHLRRVVGNAHLTFEEYTTLLVQVEAVLNSRPMTPMSADPSDFLPLTPAHFLVGRPLTAPVTADINDVPEHRLTRYQRVEQIRQHFWRRWAKEYVSELQTRSKWHEHKDDLKENTLVLIKDDKLPPLKWDLGRIIKTYPGRDGVSRVADIRKTDGIVRRAFSKICPLPLTDY